MSVSRGFAGHGLDTISARNTIAFAMEAFETGRLTKRELDGIRLHWGDGEAMIAGYNLSFEPGFINQQMQTRKYVW